MTVPSQTRQPVASPATGGGLVHLRRAGVSLLLDATDPGVPAVLHWGADLGPLTGPELAGLGTALRRPARPGTPEGRPVGILPEHTYAWFGLPGLSGHRAGRDWSPRFRRTDLRVHDEPDGTSGEPDQTPATIVVAATDDAARLDLVIEVELDPDGLLRLRAELANPADADSYQLEGLLLGLPVPPQADELLDLTGRWCRERSPQRSPFTVGSRSRESRRGKPGLDASLLMVAGTAGFGFRTGEVWGSISAGAATTGCTPNGPRTARRCSPPVSCCCPARSRWRRASATGRPGSTRRTAVGWTRCRPATTHTCAERAGRGGDRGRWW
ncbi:glycoside hydrolase family 36 N-terminal domain-containing protein [Plantactinospora veratri]